MRKTQPFVFNFTVSFPRDRLVAMVVGVNTVSIWGPSGGFFRSGIL